MIQVRFALGLVGACMLWVTAAKADENSIVLYTGYGDERQFVVEGRVLEARVAATPKSTDSWWVNMWRNLRRLINEEQKGETLVLQLGERRWTVVSDREGYFSLMDSVPSGTPVGWHRVEVRSGDGRVKSNGHVLIVPQDNSLGIISDVDDTIMISDVPSKRRLLANSLLKNYLQREPVPGVAAFFKQRLARNPHPEFSPMVYLSASPRQIHTGIQSFLDYRSFPRGVLMTKKVTNDDRSDPLLDQVRYKTNKIEDILQRLPHVRFILVGDDGEHDPEIYQSVRERHPTRVAEIWIRRVHPDPQRVRYEDQGDLVEALKPALEQSAVEYRP